MLCAYNKYLSNTDAGAAAIIYIVYMYHIYNVAVIV